VTGAFVEVNCATLRGDGAMATLFGHEKGAFTGAVGRRDGLLLAAHEGLLFLDEIGELGLDEQAMLLRALEDGTFQPLGSDRLVSSSFQLIAGTNRDLAAGVRASRFREDLLARIDLWSFDLPPLRERLEDIEPNLEYELERLSRAAGRRSRFNKEARERFVAFATAPDTPWRANFRDFGAAVTRMGTLAMGGRITTPIVDEEIERLRSHWKRLASGEDEADDGLLEQVLGADAVERLDLFDRLQLAQVLAVCVRCPSLSEAGRRLFAVSRARKKSANDAARLSKYLARFGLRWSDLVHT
jgi:transcriptional regulatory protein RtcR